MITNKQKWMVVGIFAGFILICTLLSLFNSKKESNLLYEKVGQMAGKGIGGVASKTPDSSVKIFLDGYFGVSFGKYKPSKNFETALAGLNNRTVSGIWVSDVTAMYLMQTGDYAVLTPEETPGKGEERLQFAFVFRPEDTALRDKMNEMLNSFEQNGMLEKLRRHYIYGEEGVSECTMDSKGKTIYVGITGTVPPLEMVDIRNRVSGMAVELAKYFGAYTELKIKFVVLDNETALASLMNGQVDMLACYGTSKNHSTEFPEYITSRGYCSMNGYCILVNK